jgi:ketosteroid isomerase-like protein
MSEENLEIVRRIWEAWDRRDNDAALALYDTSIEATSFAEVVGAKGGGTGTYHGLEGLGRWMRDFSELFEDFIASPEEFTDAGDWVLVRVRMSGRGKRSGAPSELVFWNAYKVRHGRVVRLESHREEADALRRAAE